MPPALVQYDERPQSKLLPARGTLFATKSEAVGSRWIQWAFVNLILFFFPSVMASAMTLVTILSTGARLNLHNHPAPHQLAYSLAYFSICAGFTMVFIAAMVFPRFFHYHLVIPLIVGHRRHRSHFSFMSHRRLNRICGKSIFTIFLLGLGRRSLPLLVTSRTTVDDLYQHLNSLGLVPSTGRANLQFVHAGRRTAWDDSLESLNVGPLSHLHLRFLVPGGANDAPPTASSSGGKRQRNTQRMEDILDAEGRDSEGETASKKAKTAPRKAPKRRRITEPNNTGRSDPEDEDFSASDSNEHDSDLEMVIPNDEIAASLPTKTVPANALRKKPLKPTTGPRKKSKAKSKAVGTLPSESEEPGELVAVPGPSKTKSKGKSRAVDPVPSEPEEQCEPASVPGPPKRKKKQPRSPIHYFFEKVGAADDGLAEEGATYHKCYLGNRTTFRITSGMNHNTSSLLLRPCSSYTIRLRPDPSGSVRTSSVLRPDPRIRLSSLPDASSELRLASVLLAVASGLGR